MGLPFMETIGSRIIKIRKQLKLSQQTLADSLNITRESIAQWESGKTKPSGGNLINCAKVLQVDAGWLQFGTASPVNDQTSAWGKDLGYLLWKDPSKIPFSLIPVLDRQQACDPYKIIDTNKQQGLELSHIPHTIIEVHDAKIGSYTFAIDMYDNSMTDNINRGDRLVFDPDLKPKPGNIIAVKLKDSNEIIIRKYRPKAVNNASSFELIAINEDWPATSINSKVDGGIIGTMIRQIRYTADS